MDALIVKQPFIRVNPLTGLAHGHIVGERITAPQRVYDILGSENEGSVTKTTVPDDHHHDEHNTAPASDEEE